MLNNYEFSIFYFASSCNELYQNNYWTRRKATIQEFLFRLI